MNEIEKTKKNELTFSEDQREILRNQIFPRELTENDFKVFLAVCSRKRLDPIQRQIYAVPRWDKKSNKNQMTIQTGIDGYRAIAARTGVYAGSDDAVFDSELQPKKATVTVYRIVGGLRCPFSASARWDQYVPKDGMDFQWRKMPHVMLGKVAEAQALRKAFPEDLNEIYTQEEMQHSEIQEVQAIDVRAKEVSDPGHPQARYDEGIKAIVSEENTLKEKRAETMNNLIGKNKMFQSKVGEAKAFVKDLVGVDVMSLSLEQCEIVNEAINTNILAKHPKKTSKNISDIADAMEPPLE